MYKSQFQKWASWYGARSIDPISCPIGDVANFLAEMFSKGYQYRSIDAYRSAISSVHDKIDGYDVGQHPLISRLLKGIFHQRPPQPRYTHTWDVGVVTTYIRASGDNISLFLQDLSHKLAMLMALTRPSTRSADLAKLDLHFRSYSVECATFHPSALSKQSRQQKHGTEFFPCFLTEDLLCPVLAFKEYENHTKQLRGMHTSLFLSVTKPHKPVTSSTIARWLKILLGKAGVNTEIFKAHSMTSASSSAAAAAGITTGDILKVADGSTEAVFQKFYHKPSASNQFGLAVLSSNSCHPKRSYKYTLIWRLSLLKYNYRTAQPTQWVPAILDYMRKAKSNNYINVPPYIHPVMNDYMNFCHEYCAHYKED